jgi:hypothetical protein
LTLSGGLFYKRLVGPRTLLDQHGDCFGVPLMDGVLEHRFAQAVLVVNPDPFGGHPKLHKSDAVCTQLGDRRRVLAVLIPQDRYDVVGLTLSDACEKGNGAVVHRRGSRCGWLH